MRHRCGRSTRPGSCSWRGDTFTEILVFHDKNQLDRFKQGHMAFAANASAVLVKAAGLEVK